ncbi:Vacuolar protein sorting-associated protein 53 [Entomophthora muscae]|uniref:Vacuolar protein sorting-associated protein 53 n=2 Tax=Entomophthora muscae TaxID=34485 RepID=A0ACC2S4R1_9FUNG|nr:Vacuolar protein sorting-associated protein 53 [Entomophthora muscae]
MSLNLKDSSPTSKRTSFEESGLDLDLIPKPGDELVTEEQSKASQVSLDFGEFDNKDFNRISLINRLMPNPSELSKIETLDKLITRQLKKTNNELCALLHKQPNQTASGASLMDGTKQNIKELLEKVELLQGKALKAESVVKEITEGIAGLDIAKRNLVQTIKFSRRLQMLLTAVEQLRAAIDRRDYATAGPLLQVVVELFSHFQGVRNIRHIFELRSTIANLQNSLLRAVMEETKSSIGAQGQVIGAAPRVALACAAIDNGHPDGKRQVMDYFLELVLQDYASSFVAGDEVSELSNVPQRFAWLKRFIETYEAGAAHVFPSHWGVACKVAQAVCEAIANDLTHLLEGETDVGLMVRTMQIALAFEGQLDKKFPVSKEGCGPLPFAGMLCCCFEPHLQRFIDREAATLKTKLAEFAATPPAADPEAAVRVLSTSTQLLLLYQESLGTLCKVTRGKFLLSLARLFFKGLEDYATQLPVLLAREDKRLLTDEELESACLVLNTAHYCHAAAGQLATRVEDLLDTSFRQQLDCSKAQEALLESASISTRRLVRGCEARFDAGWAQLSKTNWSTWNPTSRPEYARMLMTALSDVSAKVAIHYPVAHRSFCDRLAEYFISRWADTILKINKLPTVAAQQLIEDGSQILDCLFILPVSADFRKEPPATFQRMVRKQYDARIGSYLELVLFELEPPYDMFLEKFLAFAVPPQFPVFLRLMEVRGIKRTDQGPLREALQTCISVLSTNDVLGVELTTSESPSTLSPRASVNSPSFSSSEMSFLHSPILKANSLSFTPQRLQDNFRRFVGLSVTRDDPGTANPVESTTIP